MREIGAAARASVGCEGSSRNAMATILNRPDTVTLPPPRRWLEFLVVRVTSRPSQSIVQGIVSPLRMGPDWVGPARHHVRVPPAAAQRGQHPVSLRPPQAREQSVR